MNGTIISPMRLLPCNDLSMAFITTRQNVRYLIAVLNSQLIKALVEMFVHKYGDSGYLLSNQYVERLPIPQIPEEAQQPFIHLANEIIAGKQNNTNTTALEQEINTLVYALYELTDDEIAIVEKVAKQQRH